MTQQIRSHSIDMSSVLRGKDAAQAPSETCIKVENLNLFYRPIYDLFEKGLAGIRGYS